MFNMLAESKNKNKINITTPTTVTITANRTPHKQQQFLKPKVTTLPKKGSLAAMTYVCLGLKCVNCFRIICFLGLPPLPTTAAATTIPQTTSTSSLPLTFSYNTKHEFHANGLEMMLFCGTCNIPLPPPPPPRRPACNVWSCHCNQHSPNRSFIYLLRTSVTGVT